MKKYMVSMLALSVLVLSACGNLEESGGKVTTKKTTNDKVVTTGTVSDDSYQALLIDGTYKTSVARTMAANRLNSNYNLENFDRGLIELSKESFKTKDYYLQEGQYLTSEDLKSWLSRETSTNKLGLNPKSEKEPLVLQQIIEKNFLAMDSQKLGGISLGIALNSVDYSTDPATEISDEVIQTQGKKIAAQVIKRVRAIEGVGKNTPIKIGLFKQASKTSVAGGTYFATATSKKGDKLDDWTEVNESYISLATDSSQSLDDGLETKYTDFKRNVQGFFPNLSGFSGTAYYRNDELQQLSIVIESNYYSVSELESFTQFVGSSLSSIFKIEAGVTVQINQLNNTKAVVIKPTGESEITAQVFQ
ncbi:CamS family sex pheromone protein [Vagococcus xieshaowenii]|uniref:CamS family sex pheromone protein n=1 Tax=Vagococcus xieshaowenii TaxID=2562451 RepID=A0AAJ5EF27_9ENTE|nr:CamS family sex pheromone protein [Vagococcus xieshaowenii]QCA28190.1 CamS family sex pheromone protein [Vagococcus xieshaowenii]TFZ42543.1 CamS family sex pheromone protein [Vagococcus xieshaowenii]